MYRIQFLTLGKYRCTLLIGAEYILGKQKKANANAQRNNNAKQMEQRSDTEFAAMNESNTEHRHGKKTK